MDKIINWGIIGVGNVCEIKSAPAYQKVAGFHLLSVMRRNMGLAEDFANRHGVTKYSNNANSLINDPKIDAIYIATPPDSHKEYALQVAAAGKICCIEKPMAVNHQECLDILQIFKSKNLPLFVAYYRRSLPRFNQIKEWIDDGKIGKIRQYTWTLTQPPHKERDLSGNYNWRTDKKIALGGYFDDLASHGLDLFCYFFGNIVEAKGITTNQLGLYSSADAINGIWTHSNEILGSGIWNFGARTFEDKIVIYGSEGEITFSMFTNDPIQIATNKDNKSLHIKHPENIQLHHVEKMESHLNGGEIHPSTGNSAAHTSWVMDQILGR